MQLGEAKTLGVFHEHDCGVWDIDSDFYDEVAMRA